MPATWTIEEQLEFLRVELLNFLTAQHQECMPRYLKVLMEQWFARWPELDTLFPNAGAVPLTPKENKKLAKVIATQKKVRPYHEGGNLD
jgi:hypothetical protein